MEIIIRGDNVKITSAMKSYIEEKLTKLDKYLEDSSNVRAKVIVKVTKDSQNVEVTIPLKSYILRSEEAKDDFYAAVDKTIDKLERQIRKNKTRLMSKKVNNSREFALEEIKPVKEDKKIVKRKSVEVKPMNEEEAILQMELLGHDFFMYKDADTGKAAVVYKRKDKDYGLLSEE